MRLVAWNCAMALHRKFDALRRLDPDIAVISECAEPERLRKDGALDGIAGNPVWTGRNPNKGLAVFAFNDFAVRLAEPFYPTLRYVLPIHVTGCRAFPLLAVWAQNANEGSMRKNQAGPFRRALSRYNEFLSTGTSVVAGDLNNNVIWDKPGWRRNHARAIEDLERNGLISAYHALTGETQGEESVPTLYWRDRRKDGPTYHIDYVFLSRPWIDRVSAFTIGSFEDWCGSGLSDHVPVVLDIDL